MPNTVIKMKPSAFDMDGLKGTKSPAYSLAHCTAVLPSSRACMAAMSACSALPLAVAVLEKLKGQIFDVCYFKSMLISAMKCLNVL
jgi:hypothetical protein